MKINFAYNNSRPKIAIVLRSVGLEFDDRVRKEFVSLSKIADVYLYVTFENNVSEKGVSSYGLHYESFSLHTRKLFKSGSFLFLKAFEYYFKVHRKLENYDFIWAHEEYTFLFPLLYRKKPVIWDLHELPDRFISSFGKRVFKIIESNVFKIIHANRYRFQYLIERNYLNSPEKSCVINNFPDLDFLKSKSEPIDKENFIEWLDDMPLVYLQGISSNQRFPYESISAILSTTSFKIVVVGPFFGEKINQKLIEKFGNSYLNRVYFTGMINQLETSWYIKKSKFSIVFYDSSNFNQRYCEANRFYNTLVFGIPLIVGFNEPLSDIVNKYSCGVSLETDGSIINDIENGIINLLSNYTFYKKNAEQISGKFLWNHNNVFTIFK